MDETISFCQNNKYVETILKRRRFFPDINSRNNMVKTAAERAAINSRIQGSAADLIKLAMIKMAKKIAADFPVVKMILQVHDELIFEVPEEIVSEVVPEIKSIMENSMELTVPLKVDISAGNNWQEIH